MSVVTQFPPATSAEAIRWFSHKLHLETDCADVHSAQRAGEVDFVLLHVVGSKEVTTRQTRQIVIFLLVSAVMLQQLARA